MNPWPGVTSSSAAPALSTPEGALISVSVTVAPNDLEDLLDALAQLDFPVNPQIYHHAGLVYDYGDGRRETKPVTLVEFPAYELRLPEIRRVLKANGFLPECVQVSPMLEEIHETAHLEAAPAGAPYKSRVLVKHA